MEYIVLHLMLMRGVRRTLLAHVVWHYVKVVNIVS